MGSEYVNIFSIDRSLYLIVNMGAPLSPLVKATAAIADDKLIRIRSNRCLWSTPPAYSGKGSPKIHGQQFKPGDSQSWWEPEQTLESVEPKLGKIRPVKMG